MLSRWFSNPNLLTGASLVLAFTIFTVGVWHSYSITLPTNNPSAAVVPMALGFLVSGALLVALARVIRNALAYDKTTALFLRIMGVEASRIGIALLIAAGIVLMYPVY